MGKLYCKLDELAKLYCKFEELAKFGCKLDELDKLRMSSMSWISCTVSWICCKFTSYFWLLVRLKIMVNAKSKIKSK